MDVAPQEETKRQKDNRGEQPQQLQGHRPYGCKKEAWRPASKGTSCAKFIPKHAAGEPKITPHIV